MRVVAAVPALGLLAGCALGLAAPDLPVVLPLVLLVTTAVAALIAASVGTRWQPGFMTLAFTAGGVLLAHAAWQQAWRPSLRVAFESIARDQRAAALAANRAVADDDEASVVVDGLLTADATVMASGTVSLSLDVRWVGRLGGGSGRQGDAAVNPVRGRVLLSVAGAHAAGDAAAWRAGRRIRAPALLRRPSRYLDPGVPDEERIMARRGVTLVGGVKSSALVDVIAHGNPVQELAAAARARIRSSIRDSVGRFSARSAGIVTAIVVGDRSGLDAPVQTRLQEAGTYHVIAISGGNIAILAGVTLSVFRLVGALGRGAMLATVLWLAAYGFLVGGSASVDRATLMAVIYLLGRSLDLGGSPLNVLALVAGILALRDPLIVADPGFLLTFGATTAILVIAGSPRFASASRWRAMLQGMFLASLAAEVALLPVGALFFSRVTLAGLALNFAAIPLMAMAQLAGMVLVPVHEIWPAAADAVGWVAHLGAEGLVWSAALVRFAPFATWRVPPPEASMIAGYYCSLVVAWALRHRPLSCRFSPGAIVRGGALTSAALCGLAIGLPFARGGAAGDGRLHVTFLDVGQGDAAFIRFPGGAAMQVDAGGLPGGGSFDVGERVVAPALRAAGVGRLGTLVLTHGDADHVAGAAAIVREFRPWDLWEGVPVPPFVPLQLIAGEARAVSSRRVTVQPDDRVEIEGVSVVVRHPPRPEWERQEVRNDDSIVLELLWRDVSIVLTGDIGAEVEQRIVSSFAPSPLRVLKAPHHGSATSSSELFVRGLAPAIAVISVGRSNNYGHPSRLVLDRYRAAGADVYRTDQDGAVTVSTDGRSMSVATFTGRSRYLSASGSLQAQARREDIKGPTDQK